MIISKTFGGEHEEPGLQQTRPALAGNYRILGRTDEEEDFRLRRRAISRCSPTSARMTAHRWPRSRSPSYGVEMQLFEEMGRVIEIPEVGGLHHRYERRAA